MIASYVTLTAQKYQILTKLLEKIFDKTFDESNEMIDLHFVFEIMDIEQRYQEKFQPLHQMRQTLESYK